MGAFAAYAHRPAGSGIHRIQAARGSEGPRGLLAYYFAFLQTVLRRFVETPSLPVRGFVHMLELASSSDLPLLPGSQTPAPLFVMASASAFMNPQWMTDWPLPLRKRGAVMAVLVDIDPFEFIPFWARKARQRMVRVRLNPGDHGLPDNMSFRMMIERGNYSIDPDGALSERQDQIVQLAVVHILREEGKFGFSSWWRNP